MTFPDDIQFEKTSSESEREAPAEPAKKRRKVGPESEVRGGPEAPENPVPEPGEKG